MASGCAPVARSDGWRYIVESDLRSTNGRGSSGLIDERCQQHDPRRSWHSDSTVGYGVVAYDQSEGFFHRDPTFVLMTATAR